jgi:transposase-like protein
MVLPGRNKLTGEVEVDEAFLGGVKSGKRGRGAAGKVLILVATEVRTLPPSKPPTNPKRKPRKVKMIRAIGRIRLLVIPNATGATLEQGVTDLVELGSNVVTDGLASYNGLQAAGFNHSVSKTGASVGVDLLPKCHRVISLLKRWILGTHQGSMDPGFTQFYLDEFVFRFNRRSSKSRGSIFHRLLEQAAVHPQIMKQSLSQ